MTAASLQSGTKIARAICHYSDICGQVVLSSRPKRMMEPDQHMLRYNLEVQNSNKTFK